MIRTLIIALTLVATLRGQEQKPITNIDLRGLRATLAQDIQIDLELPLLMAFTDGIEISCDGKAEDCESPIDALIEIVNCLGLLDEEQDESCWSGGESSIEVRASAENTAKVRRFFDSVSRRFARSVTLELIEVDASALEGRKSARLTTSELQAILRQHPPRSRGLHHLRLGRRETLSSARRTTVLGDYQVEVAEKSRMADPETRVLFEGQEASIWVAPRLDGRFRIDIALRTAKKRGEQRRIDEVSEDIGTLELPRCGTQLFRSSSDLAAGEAFAFGASDKSGVLRILHLLKADPEPQTMTGLSILPLDHLTRSVHQSTMPVIPTPGRSSNEDWEAAMDDECEPTPPFELERLMELIGERAMSDPEGEIEWQMMSLAGDLWLLGPKEMRTRSRDLVAKMTAAYERTIDCELRWDIVDQEGLAALTGGDQTKMAKAMRYRMLLSTRIGEAAMGLGGEEWTYIREKDVEIASDSRIISPEVDGLFAGFACRVVPTMMGESQFMLDTDIVFQAPAARSQKIDSGRYEIGALDRESAHRIESHPRVTITPETWQTLTVSPVQGSDRSLVVLVKLR